MPTRYVEQYNPPIKVEVANGVLLQAAARGKMLLSARYRTSNGSTKKNKGRLLLSNSLLVPEMTVTLLSPKSMFWNEGIRTYLNDSCFFRLPTGEIFDFYETSRLYILPLCDTEPAAIPSGTLTAPKGRTKLFSFSADEIGVLVCGFVTSCMTLRVTGVSDSFMLDV